MLNIQNKNHKVKEEMGSIITQLNQKHTEQLLEAKN